MRQQICSCSLFDYAMHALIFRVLHKDTPDFPGKIVEHLTPAGLMTVFISKAKSELEEIPHHLNSQNIKGVFESLIRFEPLSFQQIHLLRSFFSSIRSAKFVLDSAQIDLSAYLLACNGSQTQKRLDLGYSCDYAVENAGDPDRVAKDFSQWLGQKKVLIPHSNLSAFLSKIS